MNRWAAFSFHLTISLAVFLGLFGLVIALWYPGILFRIDGGWAGLKLITGVDVVLGPLLTLIVFKAGKPGLKTDLGIIAALQVACMAAGIWIVYQARPIALVFAYDTFFSLSASEFKSYKKDPNVVAGFPGPWPKLIYTELPETEIGAEVASLRSQFVGDPLFMQTDKFATLPLNNSEVFSRQEGVRNDALNLVGEAVEETGSDCILSRFASAHANGFVCYDAQVGKLTRFFPLPS
ncbi:MAG: hypothetical protein R3F41_03815 [Gammaproteobacteria bacterium]|nr:hypothetical protein [Planctomycetaceae bacterium]MCB1671577.1 hypothetical protein [Pseudomonadales bacterium]MCP5345581.1 hypothetical protein [Pseudomonadales bacterium]